MPARAIASSPETPRRRVSRLPLHVNSKKPIAGRLAPSETDGSGKIEEQHPPAANLSSDRPKTTGGGTTASKPPRLATSGRKRPNTSDYSTEAPKTQKPEYEAGKMPVSLSVTLAEKSIKRKPRNKEAGRSIANGNVSSHCERATRMDAALCNP